MRYPIKTTCSGKTRALCTKLRDFTHAHPHAHELHAYSRYGVHNKSACACLKMETANGECQQLLRAVPVKISWAHQMGCGTWACPSGFASYMSGASSALGPPPLGPLGPPRMGPPRLGEEVRRKPNATGSKFDPERTYFAVLWPLCHELMVAVA